MFQYCSCDLLIDLLFHMIQIIGKNVQKAITLKQSIVSAIYN